MNFLQAIARDLQDAVKELRMHADMTQVARGAGTYSLWADHLEQDAKSIQLLAEAYKGEGR